MSEIKKIARDTLGSISKVTPRRVKKGMKYVVSRLAGTEDIHSFISQYYGDIERYNKLLERKSNVTEYHVDKVIRSVGVELADTKLRLQELEKRIQELEGTIGGDRHDRKK